jgi:hypothetical protein
VPVAVLVDIVGIEGVVPSELAETVFTVEISEVEKPD